MDYSSSLEYLYGLQHFGIKLGLENTRMLLDRLHNPQHRLNIVHLAGTNGKGSTAAALEQILRAAGLRTGLYTSPHLQSFTERIRIDNQPVTEEEVVSLTEGIRNESGGLQPTFFEFTTAMALLAFERHQVDWVVLETGLGGRLDSTNIVDPKLCILTPVGLDHAEHLGHTLAQVAAEKAGIIKPAVPVICATQEPEILEVVEARARELSAPFQLAQRDFTWKASPEAFVYRSSSLELPEFVPGLAGAYQRENLSLAIRAAELLVPELLDPELVTRALENLRWPGRLEWCGDLLLDGAHNPHAAKALASYLEEQNLSDLIWVAAIKADKDVAGILSPIFPFVQKVFFTPLEAEESVSGERLLDLAESYAVSAEFCTNPRLALQRALRERSVEQKVLVAGSLFLISALRNLCLETSGAAA